MIRRALVACLVLVGAVAGCSDDDTGSAATTTAASDGGAAAGEILDEVVPAPTEPGWPEGGWAPEVGGRTPLAGFGEVAGIITAADGTECEVCLLAAVEPEQSSRGLMHVTDEELGGYDGMLFAFDQDVSSGFWMRNTRLPLSIAYFDGDGILVSVADMEPCPDDEENCPVYPAEGPFRYAVEVPQGQLEEIGVVGLDGGEAGARDAVLRLTGTPCPVLDGSTDT